MLQYGGPEGMAVPADVQSWLRALRELSSTKPPLDSGAPQDTPAQG
jgi:hypothetical protein